MIKNNIYLIGDIGGTNSNFEVLKYENNNFKIIKKYDLLTNQIKFIEDLILNISNEIINDKSLIIENLILGVAGKIENDNIVTLTNSKLEINSKNILKKTSIKYIKIINDFTALNYSLGSLDKNELKIIQKSKIKKFNKDLIIGAGTGLGVSFKNALNIIESEAGHIRFIVENEDDLNLLKFIQKRNKKEIIEFEDILSGRGLENIYQYLIYSNKKFEKCDRNLNANLISKNKNKNLAAKNTFEIFYKYYGRFSREICLNFLPDKLYLAGGIIEKNINFNKKYFLDEFIKNDKFSKYLKSIEIIIIKNYSSSLEGLKNYIKLI